MCTFSFHELLELIELPVELLVLDLLEQHALEQIEKTSMKPKPSHLSLFGHTHLQ